MGLNIVFYKIFNNSYINMLYKINTVHSCCQNFKFIKDLKILKTSVSYEFSKLYLCSYTFHIRQNSTSRELLNYKNYFNNPCTWTHIRAYHSYQSPVKFFLNECSQNFILNYSQQLFSNFHINARNYSKKGIGEVHTHISSLKTKKRIHRKKRDVDEHSEVNAEGFDITGHHRFLTFDPDFDIPIITETKKPSREFQVVAYATADEYNLEELSASLNRQGLYYESPIVEPATNEEPLAKLSASFKASDKDPENVLHYCAAYQVSAEPRCMFLFRDGAVVFWNIPALERLNILKILSSYQTGKYAEDIVHEESETLVYTYTESATRLRSSQNLILLNESGEKSLEKFAFSNALAMSVKLGIWEASLDRYIDNIEHVTEELRIRGVVVLSQVQVLQRMGELFALRHLINLSSDLLDTPDFYWEHESLEPLYAKTASHLSIHKRTSVMNTKLSHCLELMELLKSHLNERHASRLEWIIIILIMVEVFFEILHFL